MAPYNHTCPQCGAEKQWGDQHWRTHHYRTHDPVKSATRNPEREAEIIGLFDSGLSPSQVARILGISRERVRQYLKRAGHPTHHPYKYELPPEPKPPRMAWSREVFPERNDLIVERYLARIPLREICQEFGIQATGVYHVLRRRGIPHNRKGGGHRLGTNTSRMIYERMLAGDDPRTIALDYGISRQAVTLRAQRLQELGGAYRVSHNEPLDPDTVRAIRAESGFAKDIAKKYGLGRETIWNIRRHKFYADVE